MTTKRIALLLEAISSTMVAVSLALVAVPLGLGVAGAMLIIFGIAAERQTDAQ